MSYHREQVDRFGTVIVMVESYKTQWVQLRGPTLLRCDDKAKISGHGVWILEMPCMQGVSGRLHGWRGSVYLGDQVGGFRPDPELWIRDDFTHVYEYEKDVS